jgi:hypothetical protein
MILFLTFWMHVLAWFSLAALVTVLRGLQGTMKMSTAIALGLLSFTLHMIIMKLYF